MENISKEKWKKLILETKDAVVIDVRTPAECLEGMQPNAKQIDFMSLSDFLYEVNQLDKSKSYFLYCRSGNRSGQACRYMKESGFNTYNLIGGMLDWDGDIVKV